MAITKVPYDKEVVIEGYMPPARMFSISAYNQGGSVPESLKMENKFKQTHQQQFYRILLTKTPEKYKDSNEYDLIVFTHDWKRGMLCIRNYLVPPGTTVFTPRLLWKDTGVEFRPPRKVLQDLQICTSTWVLKLLVKVRPSLPICCHFGRSIFSCGKMLQQSFGLPVRCLPSPLLLFFALSIGSCTVLANAV
jgi:hypothetical protein